jgi:4-oxalocrotonate tautomerase
MPILKVIAAQGASPEQKTALFRSMTDAVHRTTGAPKENIRIVFNEVPASHLAHTGLALGLDTTNPSHSS